MSTRKDPRKDRVDVGPELGDALDHAATDAQMSRRDLLREILGENPAIQIWLKRAKRRAPK